MATTDEVAAAVTDAFNAHDEQAMRACYAANAVFEAPGDVRLEGPEAIVGYATGWLNAFPDARLTVKNRVVAAEWAVDEFTFEGTHEDTLAGPGGEVPATGRRLVGRGIEAIRVVDGKIVEDHLYFDQVQVLTQLGLMPEPAAA
jgi:steroid delta-isomerase-like uncharacterized protein